ncbi:hypothetical protein ACJX0J_015304, partial [Zea mays]
RRRDFCSVVQMRFGLPTVNVSMLIMADGNEKDFDEEFSGSANVTTSNVQVKDDRRMVIPLRSYMQELQVVDKIVNDSEGMHLVYIFVLSIFGLFHLFGDICNYSSFSAMKRRLSSFSMDTSSVVCLMNLRQQIVVLAYGKQDIAEQARQFIHGWRGLRKELLWQPGQATPGQANPGIPRHARLAARGSASSA